MIKALPPVIILIVLAFILRNIGITNPPLEKSHNWRQSFTAMVARNFDHTTILHPEVDFDGGKKIGMEYPLFSYSIYCLNSLAGYAHWHGRIINLLVSSIGLYFFYLLLGLMFEKKHAFYATVILTFSIYFSFSRKIMPDTFSVSLTIIGLYWVCKFMQQGRQYILLIGGSVLIACGLLSKIPSVTILALGVPILVDRRLAIKNKLIAAIFVLPAFILVYYWYGVIVPSQLRNGAIQLYFPLDYFAGLSQLKEHISGVLEKFYFSSLSSYIAFILFMVAIIAVFINLFRNSFSKNKVIGAKSSDANAELNEPGKKLVILFIATCFLFFIFMMKSADYFYFHNYYIIPFVPAMAVLAGYGVVIIREKNPKIAYTILTLAVVESVLNQQHDFFIPADTKYKLQLSAIADQIVPKDRFIIINSGPNPQQLYFSDRKGWVINESSLINSRFTDSVSNNKNPVIIIDKHLHTKYTTTDFKVLYDDENYTLMEKN